MANQVDFKILPSDQFNVYSPQTRSEKIITYFTLLSKLRGDILAVSSQDDPNNIVSAYYSNVGNTQTLHLVKADGSEVTASNSFAGTVTSVDMSVPTGFAISGNPITTSGTLNVSFASGYSLPTNALQATWTTAYNRSITSAAVTGTSTKTLTLNQQDGGTITASWSDIDTGLTSVGLSMPSAFAVANSPLTVNGTIAVTGAGTSAQYIRGDGQLANFPNSGGGGSTINYYLNGSVNQGTFGGTTYYEMSKTPIAGAGTNFTRTSAQGPGYIASFITDAGDPALLNVPGGNWNLEIYFNASSSGGGPSFYGELYKVSSSNVFTLIASNSANPEGITNGTTVDQYFTSIAVPQTTLLATDRLAVRIFVTPDGRDITLHTEDNNFCEVITTFSTGLNALNGLTAQVQYFATGTSGTDFNIDSVTDTHTFNLPTASGTNRGALSSSDWTTFNSKASDAFKTIAVAGQSNVVADSATDTLTFEAGSNIIITTDAATDKITISSVGGGTGSVTSVDMSVPTGFAISGNPITTSGTLALAFASGYSLPTTASQGNWNTAYNDSITAFSYNTSTGVLTLTQQDAGILTATVTLQPFSTTNLTEGTNLYFTTTRARQSLSAGTGISYDNSTGVITNSAPDQIVSLTGGTGISTSGTYPSFTITNTLPDQTVVLNAGTGITTSGTYPNFTITNSDRGSSQNIFKNIAVAGQSTIVADSNDDTLTVASGTGISLATNATSDTLTITNTAPDQTVVLNAGTGISTSGTYPNFTITNTLPDQTVVLTGAGTTVVTGTYPSFTITSNDQYVGTVTSVATTAPITGGTITSTGTIGITQSGTASDGYLSSTDWNTFNAKIGGSGTTNYVAKFTSGSAIGNSQVFDNGTNVGIGTATPSAKLEVVSGSAPFIRATFSASYYTDFDTNGIDFRGPAQTFDFKDNGSSVVRIASGGNVGIGTTNPIYALDINNTGAATARVRVLATTNYSLLQAQNSSGVLYLGIDDSSGGGFTSGAYSRLIWSSGAYPLIFATNDIERVRITPGGTLLVGDTVVPGETAWLGTAVFGKNTYNKVIIGSLNSTTTGAYVGGHNSALNAWADLNVAGTALIFRTNETERMRLASDGNFGIGTTSPSQALHVSGSIRVTGAYYDSNNSAGTSEQILTSTATGTDWKSKSELSLVDGSGTANYVSKWSDTDTLTNSIIYDNGTNVGVGTSTPSGRFDISASTGSYMFNLTNADEPAFKLRAYNHGTASAPGLAFTYGLYYSTQENTAIKFYRGGGGTGGFMTFTSSDGAEKMRLSSDGYFGINTTSPSVKLHVQSDALGSTAGNQTYAALFQANNGNSSFLEIKDVRTSTGTDWTSAGKRIQMRIDSTYMGYVQFNGDSNSYGISFGTGGTTSDPGNVSEKMRITNGGNVGIGTTNPTYKLQVEGTSYFTAEQTILYTDAIQTMNGGTGFGLFRIYGNSNAVEFQMDAHSSNSGAATIGTYSNSDVYIKTNNTSRMVVKAGGNVGIGTLSPMGSLEVYKANSGGLGGHIILNNDGSAVGNETAILFNDSGVGSVSSVRAAISSTVEGAPYLGDIKFKTGVTTYGSLSTRMIITGAGNVGIGTTAPGSLLQVGNAGAAPTGLATLTLTGANTAPQIATKPGLYHRHAVGLGVFSDYAMSFQVNGSSALSDAMFITNDSKVGIGTTAPAEKLAVVGNIRSAGDVIASVGLGYGNYISMRHDDVNGYITITRTVNAGHLILQPYGNVGINTTSPQTKLNIDIGAGGANGTAAFRIGAISNYPSLELGIVGDYGGMIRSYGNDINYYAGHWRTVGTAATEDHSHYWYTSKNGSTDWNTPKMELDHNGNLGIGTTGPNAKLDVAGGINTRNTRVNSAEKYPVGHYSFGETVFEIDSTWTDAQLQDFFNVGGVSWIADSTAPGGYAIQIDGSVNVGAGEYDSGFPYIPVDSSQDDWYYMECYIRNDAGSSIQHYMGGIDFNQNFSSLGGNPGSYTYNVMFNYNPGTSWTKVYGYWNGFGSSYGSAGTGNTNNWVSGTKYFTPQALFNYGLNSGIRRCYISGWKCVRVRATGNRYYSNNILVSGNVGVGTTAPDAKLVITGDGSGTAKIGSAGFGSNYTGISLNGTLNTVSYNFLSSTNDNHLYINRPTGNDIYFRLANNDQVAIKSSGNVGIGTADPDTPLGGAKGFVINSGAGNDVQIRLQNNTTGSGGTDGGLLSISGSLMYLWNYENSDLIFGTNSTERARILSNGYVGIGTTAPGQKLQVDGNIYVNDDGTTGNGIMLRGADRPLIARGWDPFTSGNKTGVGRWGVYMEAAELFIGAPGTDYSNALITLGGWLLNGTRQPRLTVNNSTGNVGINTTAPTSLFHVITGSQSPSASGNMTTGAIVQSIGGGSALNFGAFNGATIATSYSWIKSAYHNNSDVYTSLALQPQGGNVGIGTTAPGYKLDVSGTIRATGDVIAYSDARVKENVETLDGALDKVMKMRGVSYNKIGEQEKKVGVIAQEILEVLPEVVSQDETGTYSVAYGNIVSVLIEAIKEQQKQIDELKSKLK